jgi:hypothetical protein
MRISERIAIALVCFGVAASAAPQPAYAFDPTVAFEEKEPTSRSIFRFFFSARKAGQQEDAIGALRYAAEQGNHAAQWKLGRMYQTGDGVEKNPAEAFNFFKQVADSYTEAQPGTPDWNFTANAMVALGHYYRIGVPEIGVAPNPGEAQVLFTTAATYFGHPDAQFELARLYLEGEDNGGDGIQAARMLKLAARDGHVGAQALLGQVLFDGKYLRRDPVRGLVMMTKALRRAGPGDIGWIRPIQEEAFALASEDERRAAIALIAAAKN